MAKPYSQDLRGRLVRAVLAGQSRRKAARSFEVSASCVIKLMQQGGLYAVYVRQLSVKQWEIVVECYETEFCASTLGVRTLTVTAS